ncbi:MAG: radical SAM family heme chaperone HemW [Lachnospiraceae bacterium]|nr:radical SAM family heme chaperone HemW [Lachnospiraceae bacterium]
MKTDKIELYIHIPFCVSKCRYCDFLSFSSDEDTVRKYTDALIREISSKKNKENITDTIFIGGGTPSLLDVKYIKEIFDSLYDDFNISDDAEITIEANPGTITKEKAKAYAELGINRVSMGLQSADNEALKKLGRIHDFNHFLESYDILRNEGMSNINVDIMSGLPGQSVAKYEETLCKVCDVNPEHISAYSLIVEEGTPFYQMYNPVDGLRRDELPDEDSEREQYYMTRDILKDAGYFRYEISNYSKPGYECRHNTGYWRGVPYIGMGLGASSLWNGTRYNNTGDMSEYIRCSMKPDSIAENVQKLTDADRMEEFMFLGLRMTEGIQISEFYEKFGVTVNEVYGEVIKKYSDMKMLEINGENMKLTDKGVDVSNIIFADFIL